MAIPGIDADSCYSVKDYADIFQEMPITASDLHKGTTKFINDGVNDVLADHITETNLSDKFSQLKKLTEEYSAYSDKKLW